MYTLALTRRQEKNNNIEQTHKLVNVVEKTFEEKILFCAFNQCFSL